MYVEMREVNNISGIAVLFAAFLEFEVDEIA